MLWLRKEKPRIFVIFARDNDTLEEEFVGIALTREQETAIGKHVDSEAVTAWTEEIVLQGWKHKLHEGSFPDHVYLVMRDGNVPGEPKGEDVSDPELLGAFVDRTDAEEDAEKRRRIEGMSQHPSKFHVWEMQFGWISERLRKDAPPIPIY